MTCSTKVFGLMVLLGGIAGCSGTAVGGGTGEADVTSAALAFHAEAAPLKDFAYDTGLVPASSPAQVQLKLSAGGGIKVDAAAERGQAGLVGKPGGGKLALDLHVKMDGRLKVDSTFKSYDGAIPGLADIDIPILASVPFDGLLLDDGDGAEATADLPETTLPDIPLGSIPGSLVITVAKGSTLTTSFHGSCLSVTGGQATYHGTSTTSGTLILKAKINLSLPAPLNKSIDLPAITVAIPKVTTSADSAAIAVAGLADSSNGACGAPAAATGTGGSTGTATGGSTPGAPPAPSAPPPPAAPTPGPDCRVLPNTAPLVTARYSTAQAPVVAGGTLVDGLYFLASETFYSNSNSTGPMAQTTLEISRGGKYMRKIDAYFATNQTLEFSDSGPIIIDGSGTVLTQDNTVCGGPTEVYLYTATPARIELRLASVPSGVSVFVRQ